MRYNQAGRPSSLYVPKAIAAGVDTINTATAKLENHASEYDQLPSGLRDLVLEYLQDAAT